MTSGSTETARRLRLGEADFAVHDANGPMIFFEGVPSFAHLAGVIDVCLIATRIQPGDDGKVTRDMSIVANLRCTKAGALELIDALKNALLLLEPSANADAKPS